MTVIFIDNREGPSMLPVILTTMGIPYTMEQLTVYDVQIHGYPVGIQGINGAVLMYLIERKDALDFIQSLLSGHLNQQLYNMSKVSKQSVLVIEGSLELAIEEGGYDRETIYSAMTGVFMRHSNEGERGNVSLLMVHDIMGFALLIKGVHKRLNDPNGLIRYPSVTLPDVSDKEDKYRSQLRSLMAFGGIGEEKARSLLRKHVSIANMCTKQPADLICEGIGLTTAKKIYDILHKEYHEVKSVDTVVLT